MSYVEDILAKLKDGEIKGASQLQTRDERKQQKSMIMRIPFLKKEAKKTARLIFPKELALPFNPMTGQPDEMFNSDSKWRPMLSVSTAISVIKKMCAEDEELKAKYAKITGVANWDLSDPETVTKADVHVFRNFITLKVFSVTAIKVNMETVTGNSYGAAYSVDFKRDPITEQIIGDTPEILKIHDLLSAVFYEMKSHVEEVVSAAKSGKPFPSDKILIQHSKLQSNPAILTDDDISKIRTDLRNDIVLVSSDIPQNFLICYELKLDNNKTPNDDFSTITKEDLEKCQRLLRYSFSDRNQLHNILHDLLDGSLKARNEYIDFVEVDMTCPNEGNKKDIGAGTAYGAPAVCRMKEVPAFESFAEALKTDLDSNWEEMEKRFLASCGIKPLTEQVVQRVQDSLQDYFDISTSPFLTERILKSYQDVINGIYGDDVLMEIDAGIRKLDMGNLDVEKAQKEARQADIVAMLNSDDDIDDSEDEIVVIG